MRTDPTNTRSAASVALLATSNLRFCLSFAAVLPSTNSSIGSDEELVLCKLSTDLGSSSSRIAGVEAPESRPSSSLNPL